MTRHHNWERCLDEMVAKAKSSPFVWGEHDCCLWVCNAVKEMTGVDMAADFRGKYDSTRGAMKAIRDFAGGGLAELCEKKAAEHGLPEVPTAMAQRGDVVLVDNEGNDALGIVGLDGMSACCAGPNGMVALPRERWKKAWRVGS